MLLLGALGGTFQTVSAQETEAVRRVAPSDTVAGPAAADTLSEILQTLVVRVTRPLVVGGSSAFEADLDSIAFLPPSASLAQLLREMPLIRATENSRGETQLTLRGSGARQVPVLLDGTALTYGWDNRTDLSLIPLTGVRQVTTVRGLSALLAGPNVLGGVMRLEMAGAPFSADHAEPARLRTAIDTGGGQAVDGGFGSVIGDGTQLLVRGGGGYRRRGEVPIPEEVDQPPPAESGTLLNSDLWQANGFLALRLQGSGAGWASLSSVVTTAERGVPPELHVADPRLWRLPETSRWATVVSGGADWLGSGGRWRIGGSFGADLGHGEIVAYATPDYEGVVGSESADDRTLTSRLFVDLRLGTGLLASAFTFADTEHDETIDLVDFATYRQRLWSGALEFEQPLFDGADGSGAAITVGGSLDGSDTPETGGRPRRDALWNWGLKATGSVTLRSGATSIHAGFSRRARFPSLRELYSGALGRFVPNPELNAEVLVVGEVGLTASGAGWTVQGVAFHQRLDEAIVRTGLGDGRFTRENRDRVLSTGVELLGSLRWGPLFGSLDLTLQNVELEDATAPETQRRPEYQPAASGSLELGVRAPLGIDTRLLLSHVGRRYCVNPDSGSDEQLDADTSLGFQVWRDWSLKAGPLHRFRALAALDNLGDAVLYDQCGLVRPGRRIQLEIG